MPVGVVNAGAISMKHIVILMAACCAVTLLGHASPLFGQDCGGAIVAWGDSSSGQYDLPSPNEGFVAVAAGGHHSLALKTDTSIVAWGNNDWGQCDVPSPNADFTAVAASAADSWSAMGGGGGGIHSLGLKRNGAIVAWGDNSSGQCDVPAPNTGFTTIAAGLSHSLGLKADGSIVAWGNNYWGQCDVPAPNADFVAIAAGASHSLGLKSDGSIVAWGNNWAGQCDVPEPNTGFVAIAAGGFIGVGRGCGFSLGLKSDGSIAAWGACSQCPVPEPNAGFTAISAAAYHWLGLKVRRLGGGVGFLGSWGLACRSARPQRGLRGDRGGV